MNQPDISIAVPTYRRGSRIVETIECLLKLDLKPLEILIVDQTETHPPEIEQKLATYDKAEKINWIRLERPSIPHAMNTALCATKAGVLLFLDDDMYPKQGILVGHLKNYSNQEVWGVVGKVSEKGLKPTKNQAGAANESGLASSLSADLDFDFAFGRRSLVRNCKAGNLSVRVSKALKIGGFDETFEGSAFRFETDFCRRIYNSGGQMLYDPEPEIDHLHESSGGTREFGKNVDQADYRHFVGDYYFAFRCGKGIEILYYLLGRLKVTLLNRYTLTHPWKVPAKIGAHLRACRKARELVAQPPKLISSSDNRYI